MPMSSLVSSSFVSLYGRRLICRYTARLGCGNLPPAAVACFPALDVRRRAFLASGPYRGAKLPSRETSARRRHAAPLPPQRGQARAPPFFFTWARLAIGAAVAAAAPFVHCKWASFLRIRSEVEMVKDAAETAVEVVEEVAAAAEKVSAEVAERVPAEDGRMRRAAVVVEHASKEVVQEAHLALDIIHKLDVIEVYDLKVDEIEEDVKAMIKPIADHGKHKRDH